MSDVVTVIADTVQLVEIVTESGTVLVDSGAVQTIEIITVGPQGSQGNTGEQGVQGETGPSPTFEQHFADATDTWYVVHPLNAKPTVTTMDLNGDEIIGDITYDGIVAVTITFGMPFAGTAILKA